MIDDNPTSDRDRLLYLFIAVAVLINFSGLLIPIAGPDAALYATISKNMVLRHDYVQLFYRGADWLDKPHFPFWITALSFRLFGFATWAYKLPGILFMMMGARYTWLLAKALYNEYVAIWSTIILLTALHIILSDNDVRAEPYLTGLIIAAVYYFYKAVNSTSFWPLLWGSIFTACAMMTKGPFALVPIGGAVAGHLVLTRQWRLLFHWRWLLAIVLTGIFILPELWCLYRQFDMHPEKLVFGRTGVSGIRFFFWDSQFGRFFNTGPIKGSGDPFFFLHTFLWAFLPWSLLAVAAIFQLIKKGRSQAKEWYCISGALLTFLLFSASGFQLPHYLNIIFPFFAIITAQYLYYVTSKRAVMAIKITQTIVIALILILIDVLHFYFRPQTFSLYTAATLLMLLAMMLFYRSVIGLPGYQAVTIRTMLTAFILSLYLNLSFYPSLMKYQAGSEAAFWINSYNIDALPVAVTEINDEDETPFEFYSNTPVTFLKNFKDSLPARPFLLYIRADEVKKLQSKGLAVQPLAIFDRYWVTRLRMTFLDHRTRRGELTEMAVVKVR
ncbi:MAG TPA: glycosyltransferase family 39 protein [Mucilaginibacter sp.]|nr:glycosyltransferase family 39 protein [Mucilaginibacter sp.]